MIAITTIDTLPDYCYECPCHDGESGYCQADKELRYSICRPYWCPLKEIYDDQEKQQSGMIDRDRLIKAWEIFRDGLIKIEKMFNEGGEKNDP